MRALDVFEIDPWQSLLSAAVSLIRKVKDSGPGWISVNGRNEVRPIPTTADSTDRDPWTRFVELERPRSMEIGDMQLGHILTHGHAIEVLRGYAVQTALPDGRAQGGKGNSGCFPGDEPVIVDLDFAHRRRTSWLKAANREESDQTPLRERDADPRRAGYWNLMDSLGDMHGHVLKYAYSFLEMRTGAVSPEDLRAFGRILWPAEPRVSQS